MRIVGIIPARYASSRFPGKPLVDIQGKPMIQRVYEQAVKANKLNDVYVATDDERIYNTVTDFGGKVMFTSSQHCNGTERCNEALSILAKQGKMFDVAINIQGDEPFISPIQINKVADIFLMHPLAELATLVKQLKDIDKLHNPSIIKVVLDADKRALYFSRLPIPYCRDISLEDALKQGVFYKHIGIYGYKTNILSKIVQGAPSVLELAESLEQLRWLQLGYRIYTDITEIESHSVDTPADLLTIH